MSYIFGGDTGISYEQLQQRRKMVDRLRLQNARTPKNVGEGIQAIARALVARGVDRQNVEADKKMTESLNSAFEDILGGSFDNYSSSAYGPYTPAAEKSLGLDMGTEGKLPQGDSVTVGDKTYDMGQPVGSDYASAIAAVESGGRYDAVGPATKSGNRAYGKYQVMDFNIGPWTEKHLGRRMTTQEFLANPRAQDAVFNAEFGSYVKKYGNPQDAASVWFSGRPMAKAGNSSDGYTTVPQYVAKFNKALGQPTGQARQPARTTGSFDPSIAKIAALVSHPALPEGQKMVLGALLKQKLAQSQPQQPDYQFVDGIGMVDMNNPPPEMMAGQYEAPMDKPSSVQEYEYARQNGFQGSYNDFLTAKGKASAPSVSTTVNTGNQPDSRPMADKPAKGYQRRWDPEKQTWVDEPIPGGEVAREAEVADEKKSERNRQQQIKMGTTLTNLQMNIDEIEDGGFPVTGGLGAMAGAIPGTAASDWRVRNQQITTEGALAEVQNMRDNSPTGGAVGQLTDSEREAIALAATGISSAQSAEEYVRAAKNYRKVMLDTALKDGKGGVLPYKIDEQGNVLVDGDVWFGTDTQPDFPDVSQMSASEIRKLRESNPSENWTEEQRAAVLKRLRELRGD